MPLVQQGRTTGVLLIDWESAPADAERAFAASLGTALAPALALQTQATRGLGSHLRQATQAGWQALVGPRHAGAKLLAVVALLLLLAGQFVDGDYQVRAPATIEGQVLRAAVAAYDGYIASAPVRAGDTVHAGDVLARLDDRDLQLEFNKSSADTELADRRLREALARGEAVAIRIAQAEAQQAGAELALVKARLAHTVITAPLDGLVVRGDLSQQLGAPVEQGKVLFEVAPLDAWRVVLKVDERDIVMLRVGQSAELVLAGLPGVQHALEVTRISPLAVAEDGRNSFRVEARVLNAVTAIQPGMEGVGRIRAGRRPWLWIGLHRLADWFSYTAWTWGL
jgi:RND family efflux transporter MFP subunit